MPKIGATIPAEFVIVREKPTDEQLRRLADKFNRRSTFAAKREVKR